MSTVYLNSFKQISVQQPLSEDWIDNPLKFDQKLVRCSDPDFKQFLPANVCRRNGKILKRAMVVSKLALDSAGIDSVDAVVIGSGLGCVENTEAFLQGLVYEGEEFLKPSLFMQSTHNTVASTIGISLGCHGYNNTYCHKGVSFENALLDAYLQIDSGKINSAFVGGFDEMSPTYFNILEHAGYLGGNSKGFAGEAAAGCVISNSKTDSTLCKVSAVRICYGKSDVIIRQTLQSALDDAGLQVSDISAVMTGINGKPESDDCYYKNLRTLGLNCPKLQYANVFGESYSGAVYGVYASALSISRQSLLRPTMLDDIQTVPQNILVYHHFNDKDHTFIILQQC